MVTSLFRGTESTGEGMAQIIHYRRKCIGCNSCVEQAPSRWFIDSDGKSTLKGGVFKRSCFVAQIPLVEVEENLRAAKDCPVRIIKVVCSHKLNK